MPANLKKIVGAFQMVPDPMARYKQLLFFANKLEKLPQEDQTPQNKVEGCVSQVRIVSVMHMAYREPEGLVCIWLTWPCLLPPLYMERYG